MLVYTNGTIEKKTLCYSIMYYYNGAQRYEQFLQVGWLYRALILLGLALCLPSLCVIMVIICILIFLLTSFSFPFSEWRLTNHHLSVLWHCQLGHVTHKIVSSGKLNSTIRYAVAEHDNNVYTNRHTACWEELNKTLLSLGRVSTTSSLTFV